PSSFRSRGKHKRIRCGQVQRRDAFTPDFHAPRTAARRAMDQRPTMRTETLATNIVMEANAARSRRKSVIVGSLSVYVFILFFYCSHVNRFPQAVWTGAPRHRKLARKAKEKRD